MYLKKISLLLTIFLLSISFSSGENINEINNYKNNNNFMKENVGKKFDINSIVDQIREYSDRYNLNQNQFISVVNYACSYNPESCLIYNGRLPEAFLTYAKTLIKTKANEINQAIQDSLKANSNNDFFKISPETSQKLEKIFIQFSLLAGPTTSPENLKTNQENTDAQNIQNNVNAQQASDLAQKEQELKAKQEQDAAEIAKLKEQLAAEKSKNKQESKDTTKEKQEQAADLKAKQQAAAEAKQKQEAAAEQKAKAAAELKQKQEAAAEKAKQEQAEKQKAKEAADLKAKQQAAAEEQKAREAKEAADKQKQQSANNNNNNNNNNQNTDNTDYLGQFLDFMDYMTQNKNQDKNSENLNQSSPAFKN